MIPLIIGALTTRLYNDATGGTITTFTYGGNNYRRHTFTTSGTLNVLNNPDPFRAVIIAGGGDGGYADCPTSAGTWGGGGGGYVYDGAITLGSKSVTVGASNGSSSLATVGTCGYGGHGCRTWNSTGWTAGAAGTWGGTSNGTNGEACGSDGYHPNGDPAACCRTLRDGVVLTNAGSRGPCMCGNPCGSNPGGAGIVVVEYVIA